MEEGRHFYQPPRDPVAEPVCLLTREWAERRLESPEAFLQAALTERVMGSGIEYRLPASPEMWRRLEVFMREEAECCPFLAFEAREERSEITLAVVWPQGGANND